MITPVWLQAAQHGVPRWRLLNKLLPLTVRELGFSLTHSDTVSISGTLTHSQKLTQHTGTVQGGVISLCAETIANLAAVLCVPPSHTVLATSINTHYLASCSSDLVFTAHCVHTSKRHCVWQVSVTESGTNRPIAHTTVAGTVIPQVRT